MATIYIDGKACEADPQQNLLHVCLSLGLNLPYFCWHPALNSVGADVTWIVAVTRPSPSASEILRELIVHPPVFT